MIYVIGDLHLSHSGDKPMDIFGDQWRGHAQQIRRNWLDLVQQDDLVLLPGDISWAMTLADAENDLNFLGQLPGQKVMIRGNHDYWWSGISKVRDALPSGVQALQNDAIHLNGVTVCGTRGWLLPSHPQFTTEDEKLYHRERERLHLSLLEAAKLGGPIVCMIHYPPCGPDGGSTLFTDLLEHFQVSVCVYGHLHGNAHSFRCAGLYRGVHYQLASADFIDFRPVPVLLSSTF